MVIPQFSIRLLILVTAIVAVLALVASWGGQGIAWAIGATAALGMVVLTMLVHVAMFGMIWLASLVSGRDGQPQSPSAAPQPAPSPTEPPL